MNEQDDINRYLKELNDELMRRNEQLAHLLEIMENNNRKFEQALENKLSAEFKRELVEQLKTNEHLTQQMLNLKNQLAATKKNAEWLWVQFAAWHWFIFWYENRLLAEEKLRQALEEDKQPQSTATPTPAPSTNRWHHLALTARLYPY